MTNFEAYEQLTKICKAYYEYPDLNLTMDSIEAISVAIKVLRETIKKDKIDPDTGKCYCYREYETEKYLTEFEKGVQFAKTGKIVDTAIVIEGKCFGQKNMPVVNCKGCRGRCECK